MILYTLPLQVGKLLNKLRDIINKTNLRGNIMGMFSFLDKPFRTGATQAAKQAKELGQETLAEQGVLKTDIGGLYQPTMDMGRNAMSDIASFYGVSGEYGGGYTPEQQSNIDKLAGLKSAQGGYQSQSGKGGIVGGLMSKALSGIEQGKAQEIADLEAVVSGYTPAESTKYGGQGQGAIINQAMSSPFYDQMINQGEQAVARNAQATGGFRSGSTQENLAGNSQNVLMSLVNQVLQGKQGIANAGLGATDAYGAAIQNIQAGQGATRGQIANVDIAKAAGKQNLLGGLIQGGATVGAGLAMAPVAPPAVAASDERLKTNIVKVDEKHDLSWYTWDWNKLAESVGLHGSSEGHIAQEVQKVRPDLVVEKNGYLAVNYGGF